MFFSSCFVFVFLFFFCAVNKRNICMQRFRRKCLRTMVQYKLRNVNGLLSVECRKSGERTKAMYWNQLGM